jgi:hypothetical protein
MLKLLELVTEYQTTTNIHSGHLRKNIDTANGSATGICVCDTKEEEIKYEKYKFCYLHVLRGMLTMFQPRERFLLHYVQYMLNDDILNLKKN